jgi:hypothetical protein
MWLHSLSNLASYDPVALLCKVVKADMTKGDLPFAEIKSTNVR